MTRNKQSEPDYRELTDGASQRKVLFASSPLSSLPEPIFMIHREDGAWPLQQGAMLVAVSGRLSGRQEEWYRKIFNYFVLEILSLYYF